MTIFLSLGDQDMTLPMTQARWTFLETASPEMRGYTGRSIDDYHFNNSIRQAYCNYKRFNTLLHDGRNNNRPQNETF